MDDKTVAYLTAYQSKRVAEMLVTEAPDQLVTPERVLLDMTALNGKELLDKYTRRHARFGTAPFDMNGDLLRFYPGGVTIWSGFPGAGKCLGKGTPVLMADGVIRPVEEIREGDLLLGPDSKPRRVLRLGRGREMLYRVTPQKGDSYVVNESHILSVRRTGRSQAVNISVRDWLNAKPGFRERMKGWRSGVEWRRSEVPLDPYFLGVWLGDGHQAGAIVSKPDEEVLEACEAVAGQHGLRAVRFVSNTCESVRLSGSKGVKNPVYAKLRLLGVAQKKHVPLLYRANCREVRLQVLAGLLDTDGHMSRGGFDYISAVKELSEDVAFLARSVGLAAYVSECRKGCQTGVLGTYWRVGISGDCSVIPTRIPRKQAPIRKQIKNVLNTGISVTPIGDGDYYGFELDGDGLFLLGDFTVTHNTTILRQTICHFLNRGSSVFLASLEEDPADVLVRLAATASASTEPTAKQLQAFIDEYQARFRMWGVIGIAQHAQLLAVIAQLAKEGIRHAVIDSLMCLDVANDDFEGQRKFANLVAATARAAQIHIHLVAHPRKLVSANQELDLNDVAGARELGGVADNVLFVQRQVGQQQAYGPSADVTPMCVAIKKQRHFNGALTNIEGWFNRGWKQFHLEQFPDGPLRYLPREAYDKPFAGEPSWTA